MVIYGNIWYMISTIYIYIITIIPTTSRVVFRRRVRCWRSWRPGPLDGTLDAWMSCPMDTWWVNGWVNAEWRWNSGKFLRIFDGWVNGGIIHHLWILHHLSTIYPPWNHQRSPVKKLTQIRWLNIGAWKHRRVFYDWLGTVDDFMVDKWWRIHKWWMIFTMVIDIC